MYINIKSYYVISIAIDMTFSLCLDCSLHVMMDLNKHGQFALYSFILTILHNCWTVESATSGKCFKKPSYISGYTTLQAQAGLQSEAMVEHGFNELPIKVDVQVKSPGSGPGSQHVFPGLGSSQRDDDENSPYGGVVYKYDNTSVLLYVPNKNDGYSLGTVIYTGGNSSWIGPLQLNEASADVRVRAWRPADFPAPDFESPWVSIRAQNMSGSYKEIAHNLGIEPEYVIVQVRHGDTGMVSEGIGSSMHTMHVNQDTKWGGVIYGYNDTVVRVWTPGFDSVGYLFSVADGWGNGANDTVLYGHVKIRAWRTFNANATLNAEFAYGDSTSDVRTHHLRSRVSQENGLIVVNARAVPPGSVNENIIFPAMGAVQNSVTGESFGGVVYSYSESAIRLWHPDVTGKARGYIIFIDNYWGGGIHTERAKHSRLQIKTWNSYVTCPPPTTQPPPSGVTVKSTKVTTTSINKRTTSQSSTSRTSTKSPTTPPPSPSPTAHTSTTSSKLSSKASVMSSYPVTAYPATTSKSSSKPIVLASTPKPTVAVSSPVKSTPAKSTNYTSIESTGESGGGLSSGAAAGIGIVAVLVAAGCILGTIFALLKKFKDDKNKNKKVAPEEGNDDVKENNTEETQPDDKSPSTDNTISPENNITIENGHPPETTSIPVAE